MNEMCCEYFEKMIPTFGWFSLKDDTKDLLLMPYIESSDGTKLRVNYCPSCGAKVRSEKYQGISVIWHWV